MKPSAFPRFRPLAASVVTGLCALLAVSGCGQHANPRPASSLSAQDRATLDQYEKIRAALADDDLRTAKAAAGTLATLLKPADASAPAPAALAPAAAVASAGALDRARQMFKVLSSKVIPLADGVNGYYVMTCALPSSGDWVQRSTQTDNPYFGKSLHNYGDLKK